MPEAHFDYDVDDNYFGINIISDNERIPEIREYPEKWFGLFQRMNKTFNKLVNKYIELYLGD